ncbi:unnamed protein product [Didymodactylos carnosus]|uniref:Uncharacterized protein n=1 Tax=Didymodactylos carnosus TaxID=1234261 RepID=A0A814R8F6_9BILA|nr:unnamed protein product [Didymodactylos carnosus]CAF1134970.1 unnamed protein product [Didymodactylos carnosus]CAF3894234.1 unnamed protein product [Didymodactylos carnosus]CAF3922772.1 unnamed protein product [Didymodactylos carnosus]
MNFAKVFRRQKEQRKPERVHEKLERQQQPSPHRTFQYPSYRPFSYLNTNNNNNNNNSNNRNKIIRTTKIANVHPTTTTTSNFPDQTLYRIGLTAPASPLIVTSQSDIEQPGVKVLPTTTNEVVGGGQRSNIRKLKDQRRYQSNLTNNKKWLFRSMEALDEWKGKVFQKQRTARTPPRSRSTENIPEADQDEFSNYPNYHHRPTGSPSNHRITQRLSSPSRSIEALTSRVISSIGIMRKASNPNTVSNKYNHRTRNQVLTIKKPFLSNGTINNNSNNNNGKHGGQSAILDFREISSSKFNRIKAEDIEDGEKEQSLSLTSNEDSSDQNDDNEVVTSDISFLNNGHQDDDGDDETADSWDFGISWIDSLKEQDSPQRKMEFYENLIKLLEQDTLTIDELLVLRKVLSKIWPNDDTGIANYGNRTYYTEQKKNPFTIQTKHHHNQLKIMPVGLTKHTAQRCQTVVEQQQSPVLYESLHTQQSGKQNGSGIITAKAMPYYIKINPSTTIHEQEIPIEREQQRTDYPPHLNPFDNHEQSGNISNGTKPKTDGNNTDSIRRYFERLTLLETIYEKLNHESLKSSSIMTTTETVATNPATTHIKNEEKNKKKVEQIPEKLQELEYDGNKSPNKKYRRLEKRVETREEIIDYTYSPSKYNDDKNVSTNKPQQAPFREMNVDEVHKSSLKRKAPKAPHIDISTNQSNLQTAMFTLPSIDLSANTTAQTEELTTPVQFTKSHQNSPIKELSHSLTTTATTVAAACDEEGHIFVYSNSPTKQKSHEIKTPRLLLSPSSPRQSQTLSGERIQQWLSTCDVREDDVDATTVVLNDQGTTLSKNRIPTPETETKLRFISKRVKSQSPSPERRTIAVESIPISERTRTTIVNSSSPQQQVFARTRSLANRSLEKELTESTPVNEIEPGRFRTCLKIRLEDTSKDSKKSPEKQHHYQHRASINNKNINNNISDTNDYLTRVCATTMKDIQQQEFDPISRTSYNRQAVFL